MRALVLPGRAYSPELPLLHFAGRALVEHGYEVEEVSWVGAMPTDLDLVTAWVRRHAEAAVDVDLVVAKSLGTRAASWAAESGESGLPAVWLTPLLHDAEVVAGVRANAAPQLLVGGTADELWDADVAAELAAGGCDVHQVDGADHALADPGSAVRSAEMQLDVSRALDAFLRSLR